MALIIAFLVISFVAFYIATFTFNLGNFPNNNSQDKTDSDHDGISDADEISKYHTDPHNPDTDGDYVSDSVEVQNGSDPLKIDSDGGGIDDFNELYTYQSDPSDPADDKAIIAKIPNVDVRHWTLEDGGVEGFTNEKYTNVSMRDPLVQWYAKRANIEWTSDQSGQKAGWLTVNGEDIFNGEGIGEVSPKQPSYFLTHGRTGVCVESAVTNTLILKLMGYDAKLASRPAGDYGVGHEWSEAVIDGEVYIVDGNAVYLK